MASSKRPSVLERGTSRKLGPEALSIQLIPKQVAKSVEALRDLVTHKDSQEKHHKTRDEKDKKKTTVSWATG